MNLSSRLKRCRTNSSFIAQSWTLLSWAAGSVQYELSRGSVRFYFISLFSRWRILVHSSVAKLPCIGESVCISFCTLFGPCLFCPSWTLCLGLRHTCSLSLCHSLGEPFGCSVLSSHYSFWGLHQSEVVLPQTSSFGRWAHDNAHSFHVLSSVLLLGTQTLVQFAK